MAMLSRLGGIPASAIRVAETARSANFAITRADRGRRIICTAVLTVTVPSASTLGDNFDCTLVCDGLADGEVVTCTLPSETIFMSRGNTFSIFTSHGKVGVRSDGLMALPT
jgi:hypothetical protein